MSKRISAPLEGDIAEFVANEVESGRYASPTDVVNAGIRLLEAHQMKLAELEAALDEGENSGAPEPFDFDAFLAAKQDAHG